MQYLPRIIAKFAIGVIFIYICIDGIGNVLGIVLTSIAGIWFVVSGIFDCWKAIKGVPYDESEDQGFVP
ncbi:MAG: hypothetical protein JJ974_05855 [Phycisphaerales bacterium]|nr:hypothetical protein [Phycisphaerales bacterium]